MSKKDSKVEEAVANPQGKTVAELKEIAQTLQAQMNQEQILLSQGQAKVQTHQTKILKMQGALEVMLQLIPKEEVEEMIAQEKEAHNKDNGELVEG
jgi:hypothetical protein